MSDIAVIGAGAWGTALAIVLGRQRRHRVALWAHEPNVCRDISLHRVNKQFLPDQLIPDTVLVSNDIREALQGTQIVVSVVPAAHCRGVYQQILDHGNQDALYISATKGLEEASLLRMTEVIANVLHNSAVKLPDGSLGGRRNIGALSGPTFAREVARGDPSAITIASRDPELCDIVQREFGDTRFRVYTNADVIGVELAGALKNVIAIAAGVCNGLGLGHNSIAALITRGLAEMTRLVVACGGRQETMAGLAGLGDLVLTCTGELSRNRSVGVELGRGRKLADIVAGMRGAVAEGIFTTRAAVGLARTHQVEMPITTEVDAILHSGKLPADAIRDLMTRSAKSETLLEH